MSTVEIPRVGAFPAAAPRAARPTGALDVVRALVAPLASLRLTVFLLGLSLVLVLAGTVAQIDHDVSFVLREYFRTWATWIPAAVFLPRSMAVPEWLGVYFPGGKLIGCALVINLLAAHGLRFRVVARGGRLLVGAALLVAGAVLTYAVIASGSNTAVESELSPGLQRILWHSLRASIGGAALTLAYALALSRSTAGRSEARWLWRLGAVAATLLGVLALYLFTHPDAQLDGPSLRILWQLIKATAASLVLGGGCWALFGGRAGIVLLHGGIALLILDALLTAQYAVESQMAITEGQTVSYADDIREVELALIDVGDAKRDQTVVVPWSKLVAAGKSGEVIDDRKLPFGVRVLETYGNATLRLTQPGETGKATAGLASLRIIEPLDPRSGVEMDQAVEVPAAYVELLSKRGDAGDTTDGAANRASLGVFALSPLRAAEAVTDGPLERRVALRFKRLLKPYSVTLLDFKFDKYAGSDTPKNFESVVRFVDPAHNVDRTVPIWMNNPLRYGGDTLYQSGWDKETERGTVLQVVTNANWMIPYVACVIIAAGMLVHFTQAIVRFVLRRDAEAKLLGRQAAGASDGSFGLLRNWRRPEVWIPALILLTFVGYAAGRARPERTKLGEMDLAAFGRLPVAFGGRIQPLDSLARNSLRTISGKATYVDGRYQYQSSLANLFGLQKKQPAIRWLVDVASRSPELRKHQVIRVENLDVLQALGLKPRHGFRYSLDELMPGLADGDESELQRQAALALAVPPNERDLTQQKFLEASAKVQQIVTLVSAFNPPNFPATPAEIVAAFPQIERSVVQLNAAAPRMLPPEDPAGAWTTVYEGAFQLVRRTIVDRVRPSPTNPTTMMVRILDAYAADDAGEFNSAVADYRTEVERLAAAEAQFEATAAVQAGKSSRKNSERLVVDRLGFEAWFNRFDPFVVCLVLYIVALVLSVLGWLTWPAGFNRAANWLLWFTFAIHTLGIIGRIYISGRPPVTNLYSSAVFIGWAGVGFALVMESIYRLGLGNVLAAMLGFPTMIIAYYLSFDGDGDTIGVMQAVLDTNFWLGTHVVCITLGYATTFLAGMLGLVTLVGGRIFDRLDVDQRRQLTRMTYGALCFAIFFSFVGTILGGLWADDSWGRFWGWDPKENGALMIVLWNAIVLHARWGKMCGERGLAALAVGGNIVTAWSWFGVNQMGVGLHAYGFTEGRSLAIALFMASQVAVIAAAYGAPLLTRGRTPEQLA